MFTMNVANILPARSHRGRAALHRAAGADRRRSTSSSIRRSSGRATRARRRQARRRPTSSSRRGYQHAGAAPTYVLRHQGRRVAAGMTIKQLDSPSHAIKTALRGEQRARDGRARRGAATGNKRLRAALPAGRRRHRVRPAAVPGREGELLPDDGAAAAPPRAEQIPPREYVFMVDVSGSMHGFPLDTAKALMRDLLGKLRPTDRFNVLLFSGGSRLFSDTSVAADKDNIDAAIAFIDRETRRRRHRAHARAAARDEAAAPSPRTCRARSSSSPTATSPRRPRCSSTCASTSVRPTCSRSASAAPSTAS